MSQLYARVFVKILDSSIAEDFQMRHVFEDFLKLADHKTGIVDMTRFALSRRLNIPLETLNAEIAKLEAHDPASRDPEHNGCRLARVDEHRDWGWKILNWEKYEEIKTKADNAMRVARHRETDPEIEQVWEAYPRKVGKPAAVPKIRAAISEVGLEKLLEIVRMYAASRIGEDEQFTPHPSTWFNQKRYNDNPKTFKSNGQNTRTTPAQRVDRSIGTLNEGIASRYAGLGKVAEDGTVQRP